MKSLLTSFDSFNWRRASTVAALLAVTAMYRAADGQTAPPQVISAKAGLVNLAEGDVRVNGKAVELSKNRFLEMDKGSKLETGDGRSEVLLTPGNFLRVDENSSFTLIDPNLEDVQLELHSGRALLEYGEFSDINQISVQFLGQKISFGQSGIFYLDADEKVFKVVVGEATVKVNGVLTKLKEGRMVTFNSANPTGANATIAKFDKEESTPFLRWSYVRAASNMRANQTASLQARRSGALSEGGWRGAGFIGRGFWFFDPTSGMMAYVPLGRFVNPYGMAFWDPYTAYQWTMQPYYVQQQRQVGSAIGSYGSYGNTGSWNSTYESKNSTGWNRSDSGGYSGGGYSGGTVAPSVAAPSGGGEGVRTGGAGAAGGSGGSTGGSGRGQ
jgi:hypothetical protein